MCNPPLTYKYDIFKNTTCSNPSQRLSYANGAGACSGDSYFNFKILDGILYSYPDRYCQSTPLWSANLTALTPTTALTPCVPVNTSNSSAPISIEYFGTVAGQCSYGVAGIDVPRYGLLTRPIDIFVKTLRDVGVITYLRKPTSDKTKVTLTRSART
ncbi:hypothetical protein HDU76_008743 [Blyttiomyces sp. JEL0837]|nr:hypothetical protein HDU76_008743 [Blyttiomyces sp. JEL0837]